MKKRTLALTLVLCILLGMQATPVSAEILEQGTCGEGLTWTLDDNGVLTINGTGAMEDYEYGDAPWYDYAWDINVIAIDDGVTAIGNYAFVECNRVYEINLPSQLETIGEGAFMDMKVDLMFIPASVNFIGSLAFNGTRYSELTVDENNPSYCAQDNTLFNKNKTTLISSGYYEEGGTYVVPSTITKIEPYAFENSSMKKLEIPASVTQIGEGAFIYCDFEEISVETENSSYTSQDNVLFNKDKTSLIRYAPKKVDTLYNIPGSVMGIENGAFSGCNILEEVYFSDNVEYICERAFADSEFLRKIVLPSGIKRIENRAFRFCTALEEMYIPDSVEYIGMRAFDYCVSLKYIDLPNGITCIEDQTFRGCSLLKNITVPEGVIDIYYGAFYNSGIERISFPKSLERIDSRVFYACNELTEIFYCGSGEEWETDVEIGSLNSTLDNVDTHFNTYADVLWGENVFTRWTASVNTPTLSAGASTHSKSSTAQNAVVCIAAYKGDQLLDVQMKAGSASDTVPLETSKTFAGIEQPDEIRVFSWNGLSALSPYCVSDSMDVIYE